MTGAPIGNQSMPKYLVYQKMRALAGRLHLNMNLLDFSRSVRVANLKISRACVRFSNSGRTTRAILELIAAAALNNLPTDRKLFVLIVRSRIEAKAAEKILQRYLGKLDLKYRDMDLFITVKDFIVVEKARYEEHVSGLAPDYVVWDLGEKEPKTDMDRFQEFLELARIEYRIRAEGDRILIVADSSKRSSVRYTVGSEGSAVGVFDYRGNSVKFHTEGIVKQRNGKYTRCKTNEFITPRC